MEIVAVLPFEARAPISAEAAEEFAEIFASEIVRITGARAVRPGSVPKTAGIDEAAGLARRHSASAFVAAAITDYDPYDPPRIGISVQFCRTDARPLPEADIDRIVRSASWRCGPLPLERRKAGHLITAFERIYDARDAGVLEALDSYARSQGGCGCSPFDGLREFTAVQRRYMQFVSSMAIREMLRAHGSEGH